MDAGAHATPTEGVLDADAYLLDVDGTLIDSNYLHIIAWQRALRDAGLDAPAAFIHRAIGLDSQKLLDEVVPAATGEQRERVIDRHADHYEALTPELRLLPGARDLLRGLHERGITVVLATSAPQNEVEHMLATLDADDWIHAITSGEDVETAKPAPEVFEIAVERSGVDVARCLTVGDARWDMVAAQRAGIRSIGVETGGTDGGVLREAGAVAVYRSAQSILDALPRRS